MKAQRRYYSFREDAMDWIIENGFYYVDLFGWCHPEGFCAIVEKCGAPRRPWALCVYKSAIPQKKENVS